MIYLTKGVRQRRYDVFKETNGDFYHLAQMTKAPQEALNQTADQLAEYKLNMAKYALYGRVEGVERTDKVLDAQCYLLILMMKGTTQIRASV